MGTSTWQVGASSDDCWFRRITEFWSTVYETIHCGDNDDSKYDFEGGMRFTVDTPRIPQGATINSAYLKLVAMIVDGVIPTTIIEGEDADDPATFSTAADYKARTRTSQSVNWKPSTWVAGTTYTSVDIKSIIQAIVNRAGFGTHIVLFWSHALGWGGIQQKIRAASYDNAYYDPPKLYVEWEVPVHALSLASDKPAYYVDETVLLSGVLTLDDAPVPGALVTLYRNGVPHLTATTLADGSYMFQDPPAVLGSLEYYTEHIAGLISRSPSIMVRRS